MATLEIVNQKIKDYQIVVILIVLYLWYSITVNQKAIRKLNGESMNNGYNAYASRLPTIVDSGLTTNSVAVWGNDVNGESCPTAEQANAYLATADGKYYSNTNDSFMGNPEPPVFWPIGNVQKTRDTRAANQGGHNMNYSNGNGSNGSLQYYSVQQPVLDSNGNPAFIRNRDGTSTGRPDMKTVYMPCKPGEQVVNNVCVMPSAETFNGSAGGNWINQSGLVDSFTSDADLMSGAY